MKISIRKSVFETNSSSTHALVVCKEKEKLELPYHVNFTIGEFGWEHRRLRFKEEKASYVYTLACSFNVEEDFKEKVIDWFKEDSIQYDFEFPDRDEKYGYLENGYIDHDSEAGDFYHYVMDKKENLYAFLFSDKSFIITGNDNSDDDVEEEAQVDYEHEYFYKGN